MRPRHKQAKQGAASDGGVRTVSDKHGREGHTAGPRIWLVYSREHNAWWRHNKAGYTTYIDGAGRYTKSDAQGCCNARDEQPDGSPSEVAVIAPEAQARADAAEALLVEAETVTKQALGMIVEFGDMNGFRNTTDEELGAAVSGMAKRLAAFLTELEARKP